MAFFKYKAFTADGKPANGLVEAANEDQAVKLLKDKQLFIVSVTSTQQQMLNFSFNKFQKVSTNDIVNFTRQLATMVVAGLSIPDALTILRAQTQNPLLAQALGEIERNVVGGGNFADALSRYPSYFSQTYISLVRAGESSGLLDKVLTQLADMLESQAGFRSKVVGALVYPAIVVIAMVVVVIVMMVVVMPKLTDLYKDFGITLPITTQILIGMSNFVIHEWWIMILVIAGVVVGYKQWAKTDVGRYAIDSLFLKIPLFGNLQKKLILVDFTKTLSMLIGAGIHILDALKILRGSMGNVVFQTAIDDISKKIEKGFRLGDSFAAHPEFPPIVAQMMKVGEETGKLDDTLFKISGYFQTETESVVKGLTTALEPILMVVLGLGVGFIVISIITPIYSLTSSIN